MTSKTKSIPQNSIFLPADRQRGWKFPAGMKFRVRGKEGRLFRRLCISSLRKVYVEPTTRCNLDCTTCMRHSWDEPGGTMPMGTFHKLIQDLASVKTLERMAFWGIGEPLMHSGIVEMIKLAKTIGVRTELITNGMVLNAELSRKLVLSGLDLLVVSVDGSTPASYSAIRCGADLNDLIRNIEHLNTCKSALNLHTPEIGIECVVSRKNIEELPDLAEIARRMKATRIYISNVLPYTREDKADILYWRTAGSPVTSNGPTGQASARVVLPRIDRRPEILEPLTDFLTRFNGMKTVPPQDAGRARCCPFVAKGGIAVRWDGEVSPCIPLMHSHSCFILDREKTVRRYSVGNVNRKTIDQIWKKQEYVTFRKRVIDFDFAPCNHCDCELAESNEEDCFGTPFPTCGDCLWAEGIIICP
ncbi:MAG: SPASM domain-containing protein [Desulfobacterales bacterium]|nr:SPASM domain-containing protein [Desulfobacterales bacterium]